MTIFFIYVGLLLIFLVLLGLLLVGARGLLGLSLEAFFTFDDGVLNDTLVLGEGDGDVLHGLADDEQVGDAGGEFVTGFIDDVGDTEATGVAFEGDGATDTATVGTTDGHGRYKRVLEVPFSSAR